MAASVSFLTGCRVAGAANTADVSDPDGHGTHTAGSVGAVGNNGLGVSGVAWTVGLHICKASADGSFYDAALLDCYAKCKTAGVRVVSASYGESQRTHRRRAAAAPLHAPVWRPSNASHPLASPFIPPCRRLLPSGRF